MAKINFLDNHLSVEVPQETSFTDICDEHSTGILLGCRDGACGTCLIEVLEGLEDISPITGEEEIMLPVLAEGISNARLACQCKVHGNGPISLQTLPS